VKALLDAMGGLEFDVEEGKTTCVMWQHNHCCTCDDPVCRSYRITCANGQRSRTCFTQCWQSVHCKRVPVLCTLPNILPGGPTQCCGIAQKCKRHKPDGCLTVNAVTGGEELRCPFCLIFPIMCLLHKITNHLELIKGVSLLCLPSGLPLCLCVAAFTKPRTCPEALTMGVSLYV